MHNTIIATLMAGFMVWIAIRIEHDGHVRKYAGDPQYATKADCDKQLKTFHLKGARLKKCVKVPYDRNKY